MPITSARLRDKLATFDVAYGDDVARVQYCVGDATPAWLDKTATLPIRRMLAEVLRSWDVLGDDGEPLVPPALTETATWHEILNARAQAQADAAEDILANREDAPAGGRRVPEDAWSALAIKRAYVDAWEQILVELPQEFLATVFNALLSDLLPGK